MKSQARRSSACAGQRRAKVSLTWVFKRLIPVETRTWTDREVNTYSTPSPSVTRRVMMRTDRFTSTVWPLRGPLVTTLNRGGLQESDRMATDSVLKTGIRQ